MFEDCKYRLPCNWCDKRDMLCEVVQFELDKINATYECDHAWEYMVSKETTVGKEITYRCAKCGATKLVDANGSVYESGEWMV